MARLTRAARARRYLQASMESGYTGLPREHREAKQSLMAHHARAYAGVRRHALAGASSDFDKPLTAGEREHQRHLREQEGMQEADVREARREIRAEGQRTRDDLLAGPRAAQSAAGAGAALIPGGGGNTLLYAIGIMLGLSLIYLLVAGKGAGVLTGITSALVGGVRAFVAPVDPIAAAEKALGASPIAAAKASSSESNPPASEAAPSSVSGYAKPFTGATPERVDQGQDFSLPVGAPIRAIGAGTVTSVIENWFEGEPLIAYTLDSGPAKGRSIYVAEQIAPSVKVGQKLAAGQEIGTYAASGTGIETGWATAKGQTLAEATTGYVEGEATAAGKSFSSFLSSLGVPVK